MSFRGYGLLIVVADYFGGLVLLSKYASQIFKTDKQQYMTIVVFHVVITLVNFCLAKYLNRNGAEHTVGGVRLETVVWVVGLILLLPIAMMGKDIIY